jgi:hypothetical protein
MAFLNSTRSTIAVFASLILVALYHQTRLLQSYLSITSTDTETLANLFFGTHLSDLMTSVNNDAAASLPVRKWAYAFLVGGCSDSRPEYRGFLYNVIAAAQRLKEFGSKAEVVLMIQMSVHTNETELPEYELGVLDAMGIRVHYVPKMADPVHEVFYGLVQEKFRILDLAEYSRVLFLDGDIMPLCDLDYLFELSEPESGEAVLKENVVLAWRKEAANAGFFMLKPDKDDFQLIQEVIRIKEEKALPMPFPHWDEVEGWGHKIEAPDFWRSPDGLTGTNWTWHAVFADQGLLYHWTKYVKQSVSLIIHDEVENWSSRNESAYLENTFKRGMLTNYTCEQSGLTKKPSPYRDFVHFTGKFSWRVVDIMTLMRWHF